MGCTFPEKIGAGLTFNRLLTLTAYPAPEWSVRLIMRGKSALDLVAAADGRQHRIHVGAEITRAWPPGDYWYSLRATNGDDVVEVEAGSVTVTPDMADIAGEFDGNSHASKTLAAIEAVIEKRASMDQERYRINNRELYRTPITDLLKLRDLYRAEVNRERMRACGRNPWGGVVRVRLK